MSPLWRKRIYIAISPERISLLKVGRGLKSTLQAKHDEAVAPSGKQSSWQAALDRLNQLLGEPEWQNSAVHIVLSNRLVRYAAIPFSAQLQNYSVKEAFARHYLTQIYGGVAEQWELRIQHSKAGAPSLVSAIDRGLLEGLRQMCATNKLELRAVSPYLMPVFNHFHQAIKSDPAWLVINEPGYSVFTLINGGEFVSINGVCHDNINELPVLLDRENLAGSFTEPCKSIYVYSPAWDALSAIPARGYEFIKLDMAVPEGFPSSAEGLYAMAIGGAL